MNKDGVTKEWLKSNFLTVGKLVAWLQKQDQDALVYAVEPNTGTWQEIPEECFERTQYFTTVKDQKASELYSFTHWYRGYPDAAEKAQKDVDNYFQYVEDENGICVST